MPAPIPQELRDLLGRARELHSEGATAQAVDLLESADPALQTARLWALVAHYHYLLQHYRESEVAARKSLETDPSNRLALHILGELSAKRSDYDTAELYFRETIATGSKSPHTYLRLAAIYLVRHQFQQAVDILNQGLERNMGHPDLMERLQYALTMEGRVAEAEIIRRSRMKTDPDRADIRVLLNRFEGLDRNHAIRQLQILASMDHYKNESEIHDLIGRYLMDVDRHSEAIPHFETVVAARSRNDSARLNLALCYTRSGRWESAWPIIERMAEYRRDPAFHVVRLETMMAGDRLEEALAECMRLLVENPRDKRLRRLLQVLKRRGIRPSKHESQSEPQAG